MAECDKPLTDANLVLGYLNPGALVSGELKLDMAGQIIPTTVLQPANYTVLGSMSKLARGKAYIAQNRRELAGIYDEIDRLEKTEVKLRRFTTFTPLFQWPLLTAFALLGIELFLSNTRYRRAP